jgi:hypothetical protein
MSFTPFTVLGVLAATPVPSPSPTTPPDELVTPGFGGFAVIAVLVVAVFALVWDMQRRIRRARYRSEIDAELDAEQAAQAAQDVQPSAGASTAGDAADPGTAAGEEPRGSGDPGPPRG